MKEGMEGRKEGRIRMDSRIRTEGRIEAGGLQENKIF